MLKELIFTLCLCGILNSGVKLLAPGKMQKEMNLICTLVLIVCIAARLSGDKVDMEYDASKFHSDSDYSAAVLEQTQSSLTGRLDDALAENGILADEIGIICGYDEYNYIRAEQVHVTLAPDSSDSDVDTAKNILTEMFPDSLNEVMIHGG